MKHLEQKEAVRLRQAGRSMGDIALTLGVSKSSVSLWVRNIKLSPTQRQALSKSGHRVDVVERRRLTRLNNTQTKRETIIESASKDIRSLPPGALRLVGAALYWGEGGKTVRGGVRLSNSDPAVITFMMKFFREVCGVPEKKFRGHVHTFSHLNTSKAERYWSELSGIPRKQFYRTYSKPSIASKGKKDSLPYGTFQIYVHDTELFFRITGWIKQLKELGMAK